MENIRAITGVNQNFEDNNDRVTDKLTLKRENVRAHARVISLECPWVDSNLLPLKAAESACRFRGGLCMKSAY
jgi:hypothetical protein